MVQTKPEDKKPEIKGEAKPKIDPKDAKEALDKERKERQQKCVNEIQTILKKYDCLLNPFPQIIPSKDQGVFMLGANVSVVANPEK